MQLICPHCRSTIEYSTRQPRFCSHCGQALSTAASPVSALDSPTITSAPDVESSTSLGVDANRESGRVFEPGDTIGGYRLIRRIGAGAMGSVYEAEHVSSGQHVAVKLIAPEYAMSPAAVERFRLEGRLASSITHPNCVFVLAADEDAGQPYIVMELMPGTTLTTLINEHGPLPPVEAIRKILDVIDGLQEAHRLGVIHRDVKPSNCFVDDRGRVKVGDFGLAKSVDEEKDLTHSGAFVGTVMFASPEQIKRQTLDVQSDVYSVCATLYFLLTGKAPFAGGDALAAATRIVTEDPPPAQLLRPDVPAALDRVIARGLDRDKTKRWPDLDSLRQALVSFLPGQHTIGGLGARFVAYLLDSLLIFGIALGLAWFWGPTVTADDLSYGVTQNLLDQVFNNALRDLAIRLVLCLVFYGLLEGIWGWSLGKLLMRLRVARFDSIEVPGFWRGMLRALVFFALIYAGDLAGLAIMFFAFGESAIHSPVEFGLVMAAVLVMQGIGYLVGVSLIGSTMRTGNGYRGLHEFMSGTRVLELPHRRRIRRRLDDVPFRLQIDRPSGLPERIGRFSIDGALVWDEEARVLIGQDPSLGRTVWITVRVGIQSVVERNRREITRPTRLRWVASGREKTFTWDAYLAPNGVPITAMVAQTGPLSWADAAPILDQLAEELTAACEDGSLPEILHPEQVWVSPEGRVQLLGMPLDRCDEHLVLTNHERSLLLLRRTAAWLLEGCEPSRNANRIHAPLPRFDSECLARLFPGPQAVLTPREFRNELRQVSLRPAEVSRARRLSHSCILSVMFVVTSGSLIFIATFAPLFLDLMWQFTSERLIRDYSHEMQRDLAVSQTNPDPRFRLVGLGQYASDLDNLEKLRLLVDEHHERRQARLNGSSPMMRRYLQVQEQMIGPNLESLPMKLPSYRILVERTIERGGHRPPEAVHAIQLMAVLFFPTIWTAWAFVTRGGIALKLLGIELVRRDGRRASRWQCLARALMFWTPLVICWSASLWLQNSYWEGWSDPHWRTSAHWMLIASWWFWWTALAMLTAYFVMSVVRPQRSLHDYIAGTWLVPA